MERVTAYIPAYNVSEYLARTIEGLLAQTHAFDEILVIDDGSRDNSAEIASRYPQVTLIKHPVNKGLSAARNTALRAARNELVASITPGRPEVQGAIAGMQQYLSAQGASSTTALQRSYGLINQALDAQARLWSYVDDFRYLALVCFGCVPIVFALKKAVGMKGAVSAGH